MKGRALAAAVMVALTSVPADAQFRRGMLADSTEITLFPIDPPALLLPAGSIGVEVRNVSSASARIAERLRDLLARQLTDNDSRLRIAEKSGDLIVVATITEWTENRRNSTKYVSEKRQTGTRWVTDKNGNRRSEPTYEYGRNKPSLVINGSAGLRVEVRRRAGGAVADETARHTFQEEHLTEAGPPSRDAVEDLLLDNVVRKAAGRMSPGRQPVRVLLARSDEVDKLNAFAQNRRWQEWLTALEGAKPHRDAKRDAYRLHNLAVAHESMAYESTAVEDWTTRLGLANTFIRRALSQHPDEKYIEESAERIGKTVASYGRLTELYTRAQAPVASPRSAPTASTAKRPQAPAASTPAAPAAMTNKDVVDLRIAGLDDENLIAAIKDAKAVNFDLSPAGLKGLLTAKVSNQVISAMRARAQ